GRQRRQRSSVEETVQPRTTLRRTDNEPETARRAVGRGGPPRRGADRHRARRPASGHDGYAQPTGEGRCLRDAEGARAPRQVAEQATQEGREAAAGKTEGTARQSQR